MHRRKIVLVHPAQHVVLLDGRANRILSVLTHDVREAAHLVGGDVAKAQLHGRDVVAFLSLRLDVGLEPLGQLRAVRTRGDLCRRLVLVRR